MAAASYLKASWLLLAVASCLLPSTARAAELFSARCAQVPEAAPAQGYRCELLPGEVPDAAATGSWQDDVERSGWGRLLVRTKLSARDAGAGLAAFAAGYLEGALTAGRVVQHLANAKVGAKLDPLPPGVEDFLLAGDAWAASQAEAAGPEDAYWASVRFVRGQLDGLLAGVNARLAESGERPLTRLDLLALNMVWDMDDIKSAVNATERADFDSMSGEAVSLWVQQRSHCSSVVKLLPDGSELFAGHNSWMGYHMMLRIFKRYEFGSETPIAMSSFPGYLASGDDFYQVGNLVIMETTLPNYNNDLFERVKPQSLPFWIRALVANRLARTGPDWMEVFQRHNSGTYNNMWMVVDYSKFTPGKPLPPGVLTVGEQLPGYFHYEDQTHVLGYGYWPSYNAAVYPDTARLIKQDEMAAQRGDSFSYQMVARAQIFRRDQAGVLSDEDMQRVMRYNRFQSDPIAKGDPCSQLACRADLAPEKKQAFGAIDAKYTSAAHVKAGHVVVVSGPTHDDQPAFDWRALDPALLAATAHLGQPQRFDFGWWVMRPDMSAAPWRSDEGGLPATPVHLLGLASVAVACSLAVAGLFAAKQPRFWVSGAAEPESYKALIAEGGADGWWAKSPQVAKSPCFGA